MAISFVAAGTVATGANPTVTVPAGYALDDFLIIVTAGSATTSTPTGWTQIGAQGAGQFLTTFYKFAAASESSVALTNAGTSTKAVMIAYRGVGLQDVVGTYATGTSTTATPTSQTTLLANDYVISLYASASGTASTWTANGSTTSRVNSASTASIRGLLIADELQAAAGATTARAATLGTSNTWSAFTISIREPQTLYWRGGGTQTWSTTNKAPWSTSSGGTGGLAVPNQLDNVIFDANSNTGTTAFTATLSGSRCKDLTFPSASQLDGALTFAGGTSSLFIYGNIDLSGNTSLGGFSYTGTPTVTFGATTTGKTIQTASIGFPGPVIFDGIGGGWTLSGDMGSGSSITLTNGSLALATFAILCLSFSSSNSNIRTLNYGTGLIQVSPTGAATNIDFGTITNLTVSGTPLIGILPGGSAYTTTIISNSGFTEATAPSVYVGSNPSTVSLNGNFNNIDLISAGTGPITFANNPITIYGNLNTSFFGLAAFAAGTNAWTFAATSGTKTILTSSATMDFPVVFNGLGGTWRFQDAFTQGSTRSFTFSNGTIQLAAGAITTVGSFVTSGTTLKYLQSSVSGTRATLSQSSGTVTATYLSIKDSNATGGATFDATAATNVNAGNNLGWSFSTASSGNYFLLF